MNNYTPEDTNPMTWDELDSTTNTLLAKLRDSGITFNIIAPLLRSGGISGSILAIKMRIVTMLPVQFKYSYNPTTINQILSLPDILTTLPEPMNILMTEGNTSSGSTAKKAAIAIKEKYPRAKIYLATLTKVYGGPDTLDNIEQIFYGQMTDEMFRASEQEKITHNLRTGITIFPWESTEDELADINA